MTSQGAGGEREEQEEKTAKPVGDIREKRTARKKKQCRWRWINGQLRDRGRGRGREAAVQMKLLKLPLLLHCASLNLSLDTLRDEFGVVVVGNYSACDGSLARIETVMGLGMLSLLLCAVTR